MSLAISYQMKKRMAKGGEVQKKLMSHPEKGVHQDITVGKAHGMSEAGLAQRMKWSDPKNKTESIRDAHREKLAELRAMPKANIKGLAEGGDVDDDMISQIMKKRCMSEGGMVANDTDFSADEQDADYDYLAHNDELAFHDTAKNSGDEDNDDDIIARVMRKRRG